MSGAKRGEELAFPIELSDREFRTYNPGLTKREYAAIKIMAGFAASSEDGPATIGDIAEYAVKWADALFDELDKTF